MTVGDLQQEMQFELQLGRGSDAQGACWFLRVRERASRIEILQVRLTDEQLGSLLGTSQITVSGVLRLSKNIGRERIVRTCFVPMPEALRFDGYDPEKWAAHVAKWVETDPTPRGHSPAADLCLGGAGWAARIEGDWNGHRLRRDGTYEVLFTRFVEVG